MSPSPVRRHRPRRPPRGRNRPSQRVAISRKPAIRAALIVTAMWSIATGTYFAFTQNTEDNIFHLRAQIDRQYFDEKQVEQQLTTMQQRQATLEALIGDLSTTGTIKPASIGLPDEAAPTEKPTPASPMNDTVVAPLDREASLHPRELPARATAKHHRIHRAVRHRVRAPLSAAARIAPPEPAPVATARPDFSGIADQ